MTSTLEEVEGQSVEFKASLAEEAAGIQALVAFANSRGGTVFFGVRNDGTVAGVDVGANTLENLAGAIRDHTYPSLPAFVDQKAYGERNVVVAEVGADIPPVVGVYLYSSDRLRSDAETESSQMQAFRRVGRVTQKADFMRLRQALPTDPKLGLRFFGVYRSGDDPYYVNGMVWTEEASGTAHRLVLRCTPEICAPKGIVEDLPYAELHSVESGGRSIGHSPTISIMKTAEQFHQECPGLQEQEGKVIRFHVLYLDDWDLTWEVSRDFKIVRRQGDQEHTYPDLEDAGNFSRRIVVLPPKAQIRP